MPGGSGATLFCFNSVKLFKLRDHHERDTAQSSGVESIVEVISSLVESVSCAECQLPVPIDRTIRHRNIYVCSNCKPAFLQKLAEGASINFGHLHWAGFWILFA